MGNVSGGGLAFLNVSLVSWCLPTKKLAVIWAGFARRLKVLKLRGCGSIGEEPILEIAKACPFLEEWDSAFCHKVKLPGWLSIGTYCNNLETLHGSRSRNFGNRGLEALRNGCKMLMVLYPSRDSHFATVSENAIKLFKT